MDNYNIAMQEYVKQYPELSGFPYFNASSETAGNTSIQTAYSSTWVKRYTRGHGIKSYDFAVVYMGQQDSAGTSDINATQMFSVDKFMDWIDEQNKAKNFPAFDGAKVISIENLQNQPNFAGVNEAGNVAKYMFQVRVQYYI